MRRLHGDQFPDPAITSPAELLQHMVASAIGAGAEDIYLNQGGGALSVKMRLNDNLVEQLRLEPEQASILIDHIKDAARIGAKEQGRPRSGYLQLVAECRQVRVSVSVLPARGGERVALRLEDMDRSALPLNRLGLSALQLDLLSSALAERQGMILFAGQAGSGLTTTLYAAIEHINDGARDILCAEESAERLIDGIGQIEIDGTSGLGAAAALQAMLEHRPDVAIISSLEDARTAEVAVEAARSSTLILAGLPAADSITALETLKTLVGDMSLAARALRLVVAQRLVAKLCPACVQSHPATSAEAAPLGLEQGSIIHVAEGCAACQNRGHDGHIAMFEMLNLDAETRELIAAGVDQEIIARHVFSTLPNFASSARKMVLAGVISVAEGVRALRQ